MAARFLLLCSLALTAGGQTQAREPLAVPGIILDVEQPEILLYAWQPNTAGIFADWNPDVKC
jgi:hypothetical protein